MLPVLLDLLRVARDSPGRPRTRPDALLADKAYSSCAHRTLLRKQGISRHPRTLRPARPPAAPRLRRRKARQLRPRALQGPQRHRTVLRATQAVARPGHPLRQARRHLPRRSRPTQRHPLAPQPNRRHALGVANLAALALASAVGYRLTGVAGCAVKPSCSAKENRTSGWTSTMLGGCRLVPAGLSQPALTSLHLFASWNSSSGSCCQFHDPNSLLRCQSLRCRRLLHGADRRDARSPVHGCSAATVRSASHLIREAATASASVTQRRESSDEHHSACTRRQQPALLRRSPGRRTPVPCALEPLEGPRRSTLTE